MSAMEHPTTPDQPAATDPRQTQAAGTDTGEQTRDRPHFESLTLPDLMSVPLFVAWLRKPFRRKDTPAAH